MPQLKRFYSSVKHRALTTNQGTFFEVLLDTRTVVTPKKRKLLVNREDIAELLVEEWKSQDDFIDPAKMPITKLVNSAIDVVGDDRECILEEIINYANSDLLFYRAESPEALIELQSKVWDPILIILENELGQRFIKSSGINYIEQPAISIKVLREFFSKMPDISLAAIHLLTTLTGSAILAFLVSKRLISAENAWSAAHLDEDWQNRHWGIDSEAHKRRLTQEKDFKAATLVLQS